MTIKEIIEKLVTTIKPTVDEVSVQVLVNKAVSEIEALASPGKHLAPIPALEPEKVAEPVHKDAKTHEAKSHHTARR